MQDSNASNQNRVAHTGALARWAGACARRPWRVVSAWLAIFVLLIGLNAAFHGKLINDFNIPGSDVQKATDLINAKFGGQKGAALRVVLAAPPGERLDTPERQAAITAGWSPVSLGPQVLRAETAACAALAIVMAAWSA